jgi:hypothetical protein
MDPMELRILNAYRDGDMKPHRRAAKNTALVECVQVAAEKANWPLSEQAKRASSLIGGGAGERSQIPATQLDARGQIGRPDTRSGPVTQVLPAGTTRIALSKQPVMEGARDGRAAPTQVPRYEPAAPLAPAPYQRTPSPYQPASSHPAPPAYQPPPAPPAPPPVAPAQTQHGAVRFSSVFGTRRR